MDAFTPSKRSFLTKGIVTHENSVSNENSDLQILGKKD